MRSGFVNFESGAFNHSATLPLVYLLHDIRESAERRRNSDEGGLHPVRPIHPSPNPWKPAQPNKGPTFRVFGVFRGPPPKKSHFPRTFSCNGCNGRTGSWTPPLLHVKINQKTMKPFSRAFLSALHRAFAVHPLWPSAIGYLRFVLWAPVRLPRNSGHIL